MSAMEQSLRRALEAGDASDPAFRDSIYTASERALERMLQSKGTDPDAAHAQRVRLAETINRIEEDYFVGDAGSPAADEWSDASAADTPAGGADEPSTVAEGSVPDGVPPAREMPDEDDASDRRYMLADAEEEPHPASASSVPAPAASPSPAAAEPSAEAAAWSPGAVRRPARQTSVRALARPLVIGAAVLVLLLILGIYFLYSTVLGPAASGPADEIGAILSDDGAQATAADEAEWINVFAGTQLELISTPAGGQVLAVTGVGDRPAVRLSAAGEGGEIGVSVGPGVVNVIKGRKVRVEITAGTRDGTPREFGVRCLFGGDTVCGRQRFTAVQASEPFVFDMTVPANPSASGTIRLDPGVGAANDLDLYTMRLRDLGAA